MLRRLPRRTRESDAPGERAARVGAAPPDDVVTQEAPALVMVPVNVTKGLRLSVHGSRGLSDERVKVLILEEIAKVNARMLVTHAEPDGVCRVARELAKEIALPLMLHFLDFKRRRGAWAHRSEAVLSHCEHSLFIHDGASKGTANELALAVKRRMTYTLHTLAPAKGPSQSFEADEDWAGVLGDG